jgi:hypothetical protein
MSTTVAAQPVLTVIKDEFTEVLTEESLSSSAKPTDWNVVITEKSLLKAMKTPFSPPEEIRHGLAALYNNTFPTHEDYREFTVNRLMMWGNTLDYKLFDTLYFNPSLSCLYYQKSTRTSHGTVGGGRQNQRTGQDG